MKYFYFAMPIYLFYSCKQGWTQVYTGGMTAGELLEEPT